MKKKILYLDLDGVLADFKKGLLHAAMRHQHSPYRITEDKDVDELIKAEPDFFKNLPAIPGAVEAVKKLMEHFEVYFLSTPIWGIPDSFTGKRVWVEHQFGELATKRLILTHRKDLAIGRYLVDDRTAHGAGEFKGKHIHFGTAEFPNWEAVLKHLIKRA